jgi:hypothetical protein
MRFFSRDKLCLPSRFGPLCFDLRRGLINALGLISFDIMIVYTKSIVDDQER